MTEIGEKQLTVADVAKISRGAVKLRVAESCWSKIDATRNMVIRAIERDDVVYGVTTGFGALSDRQIETGTARQLQINLLRSHACGTGAPLSTNVARTMLAFRAHALALGYSGVRRSVVELLVELYNHDIIPVVPAQGSVGASGDLAPLAHLALPLTGEGKVEFRGKTIDAGAALESAGLEPLVLEPKEALALINGTQAMTAISAIALAQAEHVLDASVAAGALTLVALSGRVASFDPLIQEVRPHAGQQKVAERLRTLLGGWEADPSANRGVQDRYSLRAMPQVIGAIADTVSFTANAIRTEINSVTDNPLFFADQDSILNGANFHGHPISLACDHLKTAMTSLTTYSERRIVSLVDPRASNLPAFLATDPGVNSGLMIAHYLAASMVSENRVLAHPASIDSLSTSADIEDYNSMGTLAARNLATVVNNASKVVAIELICAAQALDLGKIPPGPTPIFSIYRTIREHVPYIREDQFGIGDWVETVAMLIRTGELSIQEAGESLIEDGR